MVFQKMPSNHFSYVFFRIELSLLLLEQCRHQMLQSSWIILYLSIDRKMNRSVNRPYYYYFYYLTNSNTCSLWPRGRSHQHRRTISSLLTLTVNNMKRYEFDEGESTLSFYFDGLDPDDYDTCWRFRASQEFKVKTK